MLLYFFDTTGPLGDIKITYIFQDGKYQAKSINFEALEEYIFKNPPTRPSGQGGFSLLNSYLFYSHQQIPLYSCYRLKAQSLK